MIRGQEDSTAAERTTRSVSRWCSSGGFTFLGICIALFVLSLAAYLVVPVYQDRDRKSRASSTVADLKLFAAAFDDYAHDNGNWPDSAAPGDIPRGMEKALAGTHWQQPSPLGGNYTWLTDTVQQGGRVQAVIAITSNADQRVSDDVRQLDELKQAAAKGGLRLDRLRLGFRNEPIYVLEY